MALGTGVTEIADSEEEPPTSSPGAVSDAAVDKLSATACQDAQAMACSHQEPARHTADEVSIRSNGLVVDQDQPSANVRRTHIDHIGLQPVQQTHTDNSRTCTTDSQVTTDASAPRIDVTASDPDRKTGCIDVSEYDTEATALQDTEALPATVHIPRHAELTSTPNDTQMEAGGGETVRQQQSPEPGSSSLPATISQHVDFAQVDAPKQHAHGAPGSFGLRSAQNERLNPESELQEVSACNTTADAVAVSQSDAISDDPSSGSQQDRALESLTPHSRLQAESSTLIGKSSPDILTSANHFSTHTEDIPNKMEADRLPAAVHLTDTRDTVTEAAMSAVLSQWQSGCHSEKGSQNEPETNPDPASDDLYEVGHAPVITNRILFQDNSPLKDLTESSAAADSNEAYSKDQASSDMTVGEGNQDECTEKGTITQAPADSRTLQSLEEVASVVLAGAVEAQLSEAATRDTVSEFPSLPGTIDKSGIECTPARTSSEAHIQSQLNTFSADEPALSHPAIKLSPQEITLAELKAQKAALLASLAALPAVQVLIEEDQSSDVDMSDDEEPTEADIKVAANRMVKEHIKLLHEYNELKDVGQGLMGLIADQRGVRIVEVQDEFGIDAND